MASTVSLRTRTQELLTRVGPLFRPRHIHQLNALLNYLEAGRWMKAKGFDPPRFANRVLLHSAIAEPFLNIHVCYLEFGVFRGDTLRQWADRLTHFDTSFHGFDSFDGLPEHWNYAKPAGSFGGRGIPVYKDPRVRLHKGWFSDTLPSFAVPECDCLIIHLDADLYSSTKCVLDALGPHLKPGTILIFDEFYDRDHELKAFDEFLNLTQIKVHCLGATRNLQQVAFEVI